MSATSDSRRETRPAASARPGGPVLVAIDGPGGSGKSTVARRVAAALGFGYLDTGATYRAVTLLALREGVLGATGPTAGTAGAAGAADAADGLLAALAREAAGGRLTLATDPGAPDVLLDGESVATEIRGAAVTSAVSRVAAVPEVRRILVAWQRARALDEGAGCVLEGRDTGSVVATDAVLKVWLTADPAVRAARRDAQDGAAAGADLVRRDAADAGRRTDPMRPAPDALVLDTGADGVEDSVAAVLAAYRSAAAVTQ